jgi:hypothetical protein
MRVNHQIVLNEIGEADLPYRKHDERRFGTFEQIAIHLRE